MTLSSHSENGIVTIDLCKKLDFKATREFRDAYECDNVKIHKRFILNFQQTDFIDSSGLGMLLNMRDYLGGEDADIRFINCSHQVKDTLMISRFEKLFLIE